MKIVKGIGRKESLEVVEWAYKYFKDIISKRYFISIVNDATNWNNSVRLLDENDNLVGAYLFGDTQLNSDEFNGLVGVEGVLLAVDKSIRGQGWGNKLKDYPKELGVDYIWGQQLKTLGNLQDWLKRRHLYAETDYVYITIEKFKN